MKILYVIHTSPKRERFVNEYMLPCFKRYGIDDIVVWNDKNMRGQLEAWAQCAWWIISNKKDYEGTWHLEDDVIPCKGFKEISEKMPEGGNIVQGFTTTNKYSDFKGETGILPITSLPFGMQCIYIPNSYLKGFVFFMDKYVRNGLYKKKQFDSGTLYSDNVFRGTLRRYYKHDMVNVLDDCMVEHIDYLIGGRSVKRKEIRRRARKFDNHEEVERLKRWVRLEVYNGETKN